jgi:xylulokinase
MATRGAGIRRLGVGHLGTGTWEALSVLADEPPFGLVDRGFSVGPTIDADTRWSVMTSFPGGAAMGRLELLRDVRRRETALSGGSVVRVLGIAARAPDAPTGILVRGGTLGSGGGTAFAGLRLDVLAPGLARAVLEGIAFDVADAVDELASAGGRVDEIRISGGTAVDPRWIQLRADVLGLPITAVKPRDAGVAAAAALAWSATVGDRSIGEVLGRLVRHDPPVGPRPDHHERYLELRQRRSALSARLGELAKDTATIGR